MISLIVVLNQPQVVYADMQYNMQLRLPDFMQGQETIPINSETMGKYLLAIFKYSIAVVGILATVMIVVGGVIWLTSAGNVTQISAAKSYITSAIAGLVLMFGSVTILWIINPKLIDMSQLEVKEMQEIGGICCLSESDDGFSYLYPVYNILSGCDEGDSIVDKKVEECVTFSAQDLRSLCSKYSGDGKISNIIERRSIGSPSISCSTLCTGVYHKNRSQYIQGAGKEGCCICYDKYNST